MARAEMTIIYDTETREMALNHPENLSLCQEMVDRAKTIFLREYFKQLFIERKIRPASEDDVPRIGRDGKP